MEPQRKARVKPRRAPRCGIHSAIATEDMGSVRDAITEQRLHSFSGRLLRSSFLFFLQDAGAAAWRKRGRGKNRKPGMIWNGEE